MTGNRTRKRGARIIGVVAHGHNDLHARVKKLIEVFGLMSGDVDPDLPQRLDGLRMHVTGWIGTRAVDFKKIPCGMAQDALRHVTATGVAGAKNEDFSFIHNTE